MFQYELHAHTNIISQCAHVPPQEMVDLYIAGGYSGMVITDHMTPEFVEAHGGQENWQGAAEHFLTGYQAAKAALQGRDFQVFLGMELRLKGHNNEYLIYGFDEDYLLKCGDITALKSSEYFESINGKGIYMLQAHPFRNWMTVLPYSNMHGVEVFNGNVRHDSRNYLAQALAKENGLIGIAGSDFHQLGDQCQSGVSLQTKAADYRELVHLVFEQKKFELILK